ncbi:MAG: hypothetical protein ACI97A_000597 [Planctomycetota bacterium]|jgi:hypothetical protein
MASFDDADDMDDLDVFEEETDNAVALTSGLIIVTTVCLLAAIVVMFSALNQYHGVGPMAG